MSDPWRFALLIWMVFAQGAFAVDYPPVRVEDAVELPRDHGAHPDYRIEWWYVTGWLDAVDAGRPVTLGFQVTFFRVRTGAQEANPSRFAARQVLFAHAALSDPRMGRLLHDQRTAREGFGIAAAERERMDVRIDDWQLAEAPGFAATAQAGQFRTRVRARDFAYELQFAMTQPPLLNGKQGYSRKAADPRNASHYYSLPQLAVSGQVTRDGRTLQVRGSAWLDHEWSSEYLPGDAAGWDWIGINLDGGGALMAFRMRDKQGRTVWAGGSLREAGGEVQMLAPEQVEFVPQRTWQSSRTGARYPVAMRVNIRTPRRTLSGELVPLMDDQELDSQQSTGAVYWEGAVRWLLDGKQQGRGYLELTGYRERLRM